jgi:hypothetical protein
MRKSKYVKIGKDGTAEQFLEAFNKVGNTKFFPSANQQRAEALVSAAVEAFRAGDPAKVQIALARAETVEKFIGKYRFAALVLSGITKESADKQADIKLALEKVPAEKKKDILGNALCGAVTWDPIGADFFIDELLKAGADPNTRMSNEAGRLLLLAVLNRSGAVVESLSKAGAAFDKAEQYLFAEWHGSSYFSEYNEKLQHYRARFEKKPEAVAGETMGRVFEILEQMQEQIRDLTAKVDRLSGQQEAAAHSPQKGAKPRLVR